MFKTIFGKQFAAYIVTLVIGFAVLGLSLINMFQNYFIEQKIRELEKQCVLIERAVSSYYNGYVWGARTRLANALMTVYEFTDSSFFLAFVNGAPSVTPDINGEMVLKVMDEQPELFDEVFNGRIKIEHGILGGIFTENKIIVGYPIYVGGNVVAAVFVNTSLAAIEKTAQEYIKIIVICLLVSASVLGTFIYFMSKTISKPIHKISEAAKDMANGNLEKKINIKSKDEIGQLAKSFNYMAESLNNQEIHRREFIGNISHDLRSPLTSMKGFLQAILDGTIPKDNQDRYLNIIMDETERLSKLANDILYMSKIHNMEVGLNLTDFDINELIRQTVITLEPQISSKNIEMCILLDDSKVLVCADKEKIQRVIYNLLDNAVKFTDNKGIVSIEANPQDNKKVKISVKDSGIGISKEDQKRIFDRFYKADSSRGEDKKGSGLGLSIVREFIKAHGENIEIFSEIDKGCEFTFHLPLSAAKAV